MKFSVIFLAANHPIADARYQTIVEINRETVNCKTTEYQTVDKYITLHLYRVILTYIFSVAFQQFEINLTKPLYLF
ncbi:hypothetical protein NIES21_18740 [Anabaenopsis circularis NIES-21]|uniref:Uncharacterized protein n=1 Tax=Anabaenopsis circularis NIES-21 TaxID=1085406 RepID=A0A1Z4GEW5_9CYAN|nr:hypothetical protein NIES21_18740 [Anabaenopsis circularis NIES-21]